MLNFGGVVVAFQIHPCFISMILGWKLNSLQLCNLLPTWTDFHWLFSCLTGVPPWRKMAFDGCGVTDGFCGTICAKGLRRQCKMVRRQAQKKAKSPLMIQYSKFLVGGFKYFSFSPLLGEDFQFDNIFQMGWNHQPGWHWLFVQCQNMSI